MARYVDDFQGIIGHDLPGSGMDPNYRGPYGGMRMTAGRHQAAYGGYRLGHAEDFGGSGGFRGRYGGPTGPGLGRPRRGGGRYDREWSGGGVRDIRYDRELLHEFNANSPALRRGVRYDMEHLRALPRGVAPWGRGRGDRPDYSNRGVSAAGYSEGWAWGPMRGAR